MTEEYIPYSSRVHLAINKGIVASMCDTRGGDEAERRAAAGGMGDTGDAVASTSTCASTETTATESTASGGGGGGGSPPVPSCIEWAMRQWADVLVDRRDTVLVCCCLIWAALTAGWYRFEADNDMYSAFSPVGTELDRDRTEFKRFFHMDKMDMLFQTIFSDSEDEPNLLSDAMLPHVRRVLADLQHNVTYKGRNYDGYYSVRARSPYYRPNRLAMALFFEEEARSRLRYPMTRTGGEAFFTPLVLGGVDIVNSTVRTASSRVRSARSVLMRYVIRSDSRQATEDAWHFQLALRQRCSWLSAVTPLKVLAESYTTLALEGRKNTWYTLPYVPVSGLLMVIIMVLSHWSTSAARCHCAHAVAGLISVAMAYTGAMGTCFWIGLRYNDLVSVVAFLSMAIGVDDTFVLLSAWRAHAAAGSNRHRVRAMLVDAGTSITFTSLTDVVAFGIGATVRMPALRDFCIFMATALSADFLLQVTFFPAAMLVCEQLRPKYEPVHEALVRHVGAISAKLLPAAVPKVIKASGARTRSSALLSLKVNGASKGKGVAKEQSSMTVMRPLSPMVCDEERRYCEQPRADKDDDTVAQCVGDVLYGIASSRKGQLMAIVIALGILIMGSYGVAHAKVTSNFQKLIVDDSPIYHHVDLFDDYFWKEAAVLQIITKAPAVDDQPGLLRLLELVSELESLPLSLGAEVTQLWYHDLLNYANQFEMGSASGKWTFDRPGVDTVLRHYAPHFVTYHGADVGADSDTGRLMRLSTTNYVTYSKDENGSMLLDRLHFTTAFKGLDTWPARVEFFENIHAVKANYSDLAPIFYVEMGFMTDVMIYVSHTTQKSLGMVLTCTFVIVLSFLPLRQAVVTFWVSAVFLTTNLAVLGGLVLWRCDVDLISMITMLMSVGFSVDYIVHAAYQFARNSECGRGDVRVQVRLMLRAVGRPIMLSGASTLLAVAPIALVPSYMIRVFLKTVLLVVLIGMAQALLVLPALFIMTDCPMRQRELRRKRLLGAIACSATAGYARMDDAEEGVSRA